MLVLSMNSKRQRRPNVRLGAIGDIPAAFGRGVSRETKANLEQTIWENEFLIPEESELNPIWGFSEPMSSEHSISDTEISPRVSADIIQDGENKDPNSVRPVVEFPTVDELDLSKYKLSFETITQKCGVMKRKRSIRRKNGASLDAWHLTTSHGIFSGDVERNGPKELGEFALNSGFGFGIYQVSGDPSDHETLAESKEASKNGIDRPTLNLQMQVNRNGFWSRGPCCEGTSTSPLSFNGYRKVMAGSIEINGVTEWLEGHGFGKYAAAFEMHEVDKEALPLLTLEDLKEMGVLPIGPRRKLYSAIRHLSYQREKVSG